MATTAQLDGRAILDDTHIVAVLLAEQCHRPHLFGLSNRGVTALLQRIVATDQLVRQLFYLAEFFGRYLLIVREIETQRIGGNQTTLLLYMCAQHGTQRIVQNVRTRVVASNSLTACLIHLCHQFALYMLRQLGADMYRQVVLTLSIYDTSRAKHTGIAYLTTHLCIERGLGKHNLIELFALLAYLTVAKHFRLNG